jgi:hypothetical protein
LTGAKFVCANLCGNSELFQTIFKRELLALAAFHFALSLLEWAGACSTLIHRWMPNAMR